MRLHGKRNEKGGREPISPGLILALALLGAFPLGAESAAGPGSLPDNALEGIRLHNAAVKAPAMDVINRSKDLLKPFLADYPLAKAYYGSVLSLEASAEAAKKNGIKALALLEESARLIDEAVASDSGNVHLRILRMENSFGVSTGSPLDRWTVMKEDLDWLVLRYGSCPPSVRGGIDLYRGHYLVRTRDIEGALAAWESCLRDSPDSPEAAEAETLLALYGD